MSLKSYLLGFFPQYYGSLVCMFNINVSLLRDDNDFNLVKEDISAGF